MPTSRETPCIYVATHHISLRSQKALVYLPHYQYTLHKRAAL